MKFDFCIGNPPYQADVENQGDRANPVYDKFMEAAFDVADCVELIHPARFLFNAGQTPKSWNKKMLNDEHFKVLDYEPNAIKIFSNTDIKGGVAITIRDKGKDYGPINVFTKYSELNQILKKVISIEAGNEFLDSIVSSRGLYRFSDVFYGYYPNAREVVGKGSGNMIVSNAFDKLKNAFSEGKKNKDEIAILGRTNNRRIIKNIRRDYVIDNEYLDTYNVMIAEANGTGEFGEVLSAPFISPPGQGATDTFISIGFFETNEEANNLLRYIKSKFARAMLSVNKVTQHNPKKVWKSIPLQNFSNNSDINWSASFAQIDQQLFKKYELTNKEIDFIETNVKEMK